MMRVADITTNGPRRDQWGRYLIVPPAGGRPVGYTRVTTVAKTLESSDGLIPWKATMVMSGAFARPGLMAAWQALMSEHGGDPWYAGDSAKGECKALVERCAEAGGGGDRATLGTALHKLTEVVERGGDMGNVEATLAADLAAYSQCLIDTGMNLTDCLTEAVLVLDEHQVCGTADRFAVRLPGYPLPLVADLKTGSSLHFASQAIAVQIAAYAHADAGYRQGATPSKDERYELPAVDQTTGIVIHLPAGEARCELHTVDLVAGWEAFERSMWVRGWRKAKPVRPYKATVDDHVSAYIVASDEHAALRDAIAGPLAAAAAEAIKTLVGETTLARDATTLRIGAMTLKERASLKTVWRWAKLADADAVELDEIGAAVTAIEDARYTVPAETAPPPAKWTVDEGDLIADDTYQALQRAFKALDTGAVEAIRQVTKSALAAGRPVSLAELHSVRRFAIARLLIAWARWDRSEQALRDVVHMATGHDNVLQPATTIGMVIGSLTTSEADKAFDVIAALIDGATLFYDTARRPHLDVT